MESKILQIIKSDLFPLAKNIMILLILKGEESKVFKISSEEIAQQLHANPDTIRTYLVSLKNKNLIKSEVIDGKRQVTLL